MSARLLFALALCFWCAQLVVAQGDAPSTIPINYGDVVGGELTEEAFYDWWQIQATRGDQIIIEMTGQDGLEPLIGLLNGSGTLVARSENGEPNAIVDLEFTIPEDGTYTIVTTRVGNVDGTSTGRYRMRIGLSGNEFARPNPYEEVTFRCADVEAATAASLRFPVSMSPDIQRIVVIGLDGFQPLIRVSQEHTEGQTCIRTGSAEGATITLPGGSPVMLPVDGAAVADLTLDNTDKTGNLILSIASIDAAPGRYLTVVTGFAIEPSSERETIEARLGPLAAESTSLLVYMVAADNSRLDPSVMFADTEIVCDDAGRRGCEDIPAITDAGIVTADGLRVLGDRFDAGLRIPQGERAPRGIQLRSFRGNTKGEYALVLVGAMSARTLGK